MNSQSAGEPMDVGSATISMTETSDRLSRLFGEHHKRVLMAAYRITGSLADAEDVAQGVFLRVADGQGMAMSNGGSYLYRAAINGALDVLRRRKAAATEPLESASSAASTGWGSSPEKQAFGRELGEWLRQAIGELAPRTAEMFTLRYLEELENREIAVLMDTSSAVVAVTLHHARSKLKKRLREFERGNQ
jgi:RNA polymerase sigma factor (sigma-70 family)